MTTEVSEMKSSATLETALSESPFCAYCINVILKFYSNLKLLTDFIKGMKVLVFTHICCRAEN